MLNWIMTLLTIVVICVLLGSQYGCATAVDKADSAASTIVESRRNLNDKQVEAGHVLLCGSPFRAAIAYYNGEPTKLSALVELCDFHEILSAILQVDKGKAE